VRRSLALVLLVPVALVSVPVRAAPIGQGATATAPAHRLHPPERSFTLVAAGDFLAEDVVNRAAAAMAPHGVRVDYEPLLRPVEPLVRKADLAICHMETPISTPGAAIGYIGRGPYGTALIAAASESALDLRRAGFDRCSTASNHANDLGAAGIASTLAAFDAAGISHSGTARSASEAGVSRLLVNGIRVAHLAYARNSNTGFPRDAWRLNRATDASQVVRDVARARASGAEVVVVSVHVYVEMQPGPTADDRSLITRITAGAGPDLVVVHGPHVVQPVERLNGKVVFWSVGNFISGMGVAGRGTYADPRTLDGLLATARFTQRSNGTWATTASPVLLCNVPATRVVYPGISWLRRTDLSPALRASLQACRARASAVVRALT
jgi:poly-gamma-glutamate capsule biosynthesis protein CapA/YwtB (metallophosphatase superfamily)